MNFWEFASQNPILTCVLTFIVVSYITSIFDFKKTCNCGCDCEKK